MQVILKTFSFFILSISIMIGSEKNVKTHDVLDKVLINGSVNSQTDSRETTIIWEENFEGDVSGWSFGSGWELTEDDSHSPTHSVLSPNSDANMNGQFNLLSPSIVLPSIGSEEIMNFGFWLNVDHPDVDGDFDDYLDDYYSISLLDLGALAWHSTDFNSDAIGADGNNFWGGDEEVGGYLDSWIQYLDTPSIHVGSGGHLSTKIFYAIESPAGGQVTGTCTDGWDAANIRISSDGGSTWDLLTDPFNSYHFECGYGWIWNDGEYDTGGSLNHLAPGWGGDTSNRWKNFNANLSAYEGEDVIIRFAFGSDPAYSTADDASITGFQVDKITVSDDSGVIFLDDGGDMSQMNPSGEVWIDQFYDYGDIDRPGYQAWEEYVPGMPFNGNLMMDISDFAGKEVIFRIQSRYDDNHDGGQGAGFYMDDFKVTSGALVTHPAPTGLMADAGDSEVNLSWTNMNVTYVEDCSGDGDCCPDSWIGDGFSDCEEQEYGCDLTCYDNDGGDCEGEAGSGGGVGNCNDGIVLVSYNVYRDAEMIASDLDDNYFTDSGLVNNTTYEYTVSATYPDGEESDPSNSVLATPTSATTHEESHDDGTFEVEFNAGASNHSAVRYSADSSGEDIIRFKWYQAGPGGSFYIKIYDDVGGMPGGELYSSLALPGANNDGWNTKDLSTLGLSISGDFWVGTKEFSSSKPFGLDTSSDTGNSYQRTGESGDWTSVSGNLGYHVFLDCGDDCEDDSECPSAGTGDVNGDDSIDVQDIVTVVSVILGGSFADDCSEESADINSDGSIDVQDIVGIISIILGGRNSVNDATTGELIRSNNAVRLEANGYVGGVQMTLSHGNNFSIELTSQSMLSEYKTVDNSTILVIVTPESDELFTYVGDFEIVDMIIVNSVDRINVDAPTTFSLSEAYPNPFNPTTNISFSISKTSEITLSIYDLQGREIASLIKGEMQPGLHSITWNASEEVSGMYLVKMMAGDFMETGKLMLVK